MSSQRESPTSDIPSDSGLGTLSIRDKSLLKRNINKHHNNNMSAGYVPVHEDSLHKTGLRGKKTYAFWTLVGLLCLLACANMILTLIILKVLRLGQGMESIEIMPDKSIVKFHGNTDLGKIYKKNGKLEGFRNEPVQITGNNGQISIDVRDSSSTISKVLQIKQNESHIKGVESFNVRDIKTNSSVFSTDFPNFGLPRGVRNINVKLAETHRIVSPRDDKLVLKSDTITRLIGNEGITIEGKDIDWSADQFVFLKSMNGSIILKGEQGIMLDIKSIPIVGSGSRSGMPVSAQYKVCVCMPKGKLFRVRVDTGSSSSTACHYVNLTPQLNPCI
ncbi:sarcoglycan beta [Lycorma delicatula]|uniref:sarcoglycan beta n=1 Tax=Lycorma delicatula TaxID=130591 RepID=UPI003F514F30